MKTEEKVMFLRYELFLGLSRGEDEARKSRCWSSAFSSGEHDHRKLAGCLRLVLGEKGIPCHFPGPPPIPPCICFDNSDGVEGLGPHLDRYFRGRPQIWIPVRGSWCATIGRADE